MEIRNIFKISRKTFFNPREWLGYDSLKESHIAIKENVLEAFKKEKPQYQESFGEAMNRLKLSEEDVAQRISTYRSYAFSFLFLAVIIFLYTFHILFRYMYFTPWLMGMGVTGLFLAQAFRYHFWAYQMQQRRLGITYAEWKNHILGIKSTNP